VGHDLLAESPLRVERICGNDPSGKLQPTQQFRRPGQFGIGFVVIETERVLTDDHAGLETHRVEQLHHPGWRIGIGLAASLCLTIESTSAQCSRRPESRLAGTQVRGDRRGHRDRIKPGEQSR
jgi:hypothetical protein